MELITSAQNPKIKGAKRLWKRREREKTDTFLIEGYRVSFGGCHGGYQAQQ